MVDLVLFNGFKNSAFMSRFDITENGEKNRSLKKPSLLKNKNKFDYKKI